MSGAVPGPEFPFSAVVGHDDLRLALVLNAVHPGVGGVLVRGEKGTAKSTAVRALAALLPAVEVVEGCRFGCAPAAPDPGCPDGPHTGASATTRPARLVELPVGTTEDRLVGSLDLEKALSEGTRAYQPGLLAEAHRGVLYVDEVNLLHDHLVDLLLDASAMGRARVEVVRRRMAFEADPAGFGRSWAAADAEVAARIVAARDRIDAVGLSDRELRRIAFVCARFDVDGMRADLVIARTAVAHAAWRGTAAVAEEDVRVAARLALPHRRRRDPFDEPGIDEKDLDEALRDAEEDLGPEDPTDPDDDPGGEPRDETDGPEDGPDADGGAQPADPDSDPDSDAAQTPPRSAAEQQPGPERSEQPGPEQNGPGPRTDAVEPVDAPQDRPEAMGAGSAMPVGAPARLSRVAARRFTVPGVGDGAPGRRSRARTDTGRVVRPSDATPRRAADLHLPATVAAAAPFQRERGRRGPGLLLQRADLRAALREGREGNLVLFVVDASGSMAARKRMATVSGAVLALLRDAYQRRDKVGLVTFRSAGAELVLPPTTSVPTAQVRMAAMRTGGRTPLADGLLLARRTLAAERVRDPRRRPLVVLLTDGRATVATRPGGDPVADARRAAGLLAADGVHTVVVDCESGFVKLGLAGQVAAAAGAPVITVDELTVADLTAAATA